MKGESIGVWGASPKIKANLQRRKSVTLYQGNIEFLPNHNLALPDYAVRLIFIDKNSPAALVHRTSQMLHLESDRTFVASSEPNVFPAYQDQQAAINALIGWLDRVYQKSKQPSAFISTGHPVGDALREAFKRGFPYPTKAAQSEKENSDK